MSDVLFGGTIPFLFTILVREVFIRRFRTVKEIFSFRRKKPLTVPERIVCLDILPELSCFAAVFGGAKKEVPLSL